MRNIFSVRQRDLTFSVNKTLSEVLIKFKIIQYTITKGNVELHTKYYCWSEPVYYILSAFTSHFLVVLDD